MSDVPYILHITLDTGLRRRLHADDVDPAAVTIVGQMAAEMLATGRADIRPGYVLTGSSAGAALVATIESADLGPLVSLGVARKSRVSSRLWAAMGGIGPHPDAPWCAAKLYPCLGCDLGSVDWIMDFERCLAWAWVEGRAGSFLSTPP